MATPAKAKRPVMGWQAPTVTTSSAARAAGESPRETAATRARRRNVGFMRVSSFVSLLERPQREEALDAVPDLGEPVGLEDQEDDDEQAEDHVAQREEVGLRVGPEGAGQSGAGLEHLRDQGHEDRPVDGALDRAQAAHDDDGQELDGEG